ncbi:hypothetical protein [Clostridium botulinum]|uniref:hypothetical protein n=3 Tax=Clostridium botulinum TaxID=1491 RepID=UPI000A639039|nr:hypothetical protein [Clostridium botulinum]
MNLNSLFNSCIGMHKSKINNINKGTKGTIKLVKKYGYDTKQALHSYRLLDFLERYENTGFKDFKKALYYKDWEKEKVLNIKFGEFSLEEFKTIPMEKLNKVLTLEKY